MSGGVIRFLRTERNPDELRAALDVVREFKETENTEEWLIASFESWVKLEQLEEFLAFLVEGKELDEDTKRQLEKHPL